MPCYSILPRLSRIVSFALILALALLIAAPDANAAHKSPNANAAHKSKAKTKKAENPYKQAMTLLDDGKAEAAMEIASRYRKSPLYNVVRASYMAAPGNNVSFQEMASFIDRNPAWPNLNVS